MKRTFSTLVESVKRKKWKPFVAMLCVVVLLATLAAGCRGNQPMAPDGGGGDSPGVTTTTNAATTATIKDEPLATTTGTEMTGAITTTTVNTSSADKTETTTQGGSASVTKTTASKPTKTTATKTKATKTTTATKVTAGKQSYLDTSKLTYTQEDVGKVVGYSRTLGKDITVVKVTESFNGSGLKGVIVDFSDGNSTCIVECRYCHEMPCPDGGGEACSEYDVKIDGTKTCQRCGLPKGDGHNGTCLGIIDWDNGGKISCNHYD